MQSGLGACLSQSLIRNYNHRSLLLVGEEGPEWTPVESPRVVEEDLGWCHYCLEKAVCSTLKAVSVETLGLQLVIRQSPFKWRLKQ